MSEAFFFLKTLRVYVVMKVWTNSNMSTLRVTLTLDFDRHSTRRPCQIKIWDQKFQQNYKNVPDEF